MSAPNTTANSNTTATGASKRALWTIGAISILTAVFGFMYYKKPQHVHGKIDACKDRLRQMGPRPEDKPANKGIVWAAIIGGVAIIGAAIHFLCRPESWRKLRKSKAEAPAKA